MIRNFLLFPILLLILTCCTQNNSWDKEIPTFRKEIGFTTLCVSYVNADSIPSDFVDIVTCNYGGEILTHHALFNDSCLQISWVQVGTGKVSILDNSLHRKISFFVHPCVKNEILIDISLYNSGGEFIKSNNDLNNLNRLYSHIRSKENQLLFLEILPIQTKDLVVQKIQVLHDSICAKQTKNMSDFQRNLYLELSKREIFECIYLYNWYNKNGNLEMFDLNKTIKCLDFNDDLMPFLNQSEIYALDLSEPSAQYGKNLTNLSQLCQLIQENNNDRWSSAKENVTNFIDDDFCIEVYKYYREQVLLEEIHNPNGVFVEETPVVSDADLLKTIINKYKGQKILIDFWGTKCVPCMKDINTNENQKDNSITYLYITCPMWSPYIEWNSTINNIKGHHYFLSNNSFLFILNQFKAVGIPFKLSVSPTGDIIND